LLVLLGIIIIVVITLLNDGDNSSVSPACLSPSFNKVIIVVITLLNDGDKHAGETLELSTGLIIKYFIAGVCASSAMLLPGISGSFMLLVFGVYGTVMFSISEFMSLNFNAVPILMI